MGDYWGKRIFWLLLTVFVIVPIVSLCSWGIYTAANQETDVERVQRIIKEVQNEQLKASLDIDRAIDDSRERSGLPRLRTER